ncbi:protein associated with UVRAG as autophagy enhancer [Pyxicephalus adspersus]|uniref:protein associated with UVRAG as autophagy enhancer n=1 Tax=Pyxicephalus adspersus TaxID=30357 RepID=UPI003B5CF23A
MYALAVLASSLYYEWLADLSGSNFSRLPAMSVHALTLTGYKTKRVQTRTSVAQGNSAASCYTELKSLRVPEPSLTKMPRISTVLFPADELPRPAVIGMGGGKGSYKDSATAIKEILASVLNIPSPAKSKSTGNTEIQDSDAENLEECSDPDCTPGVSSSQHNFPLTRHKASWDNAKSDSSLTPAVEPTTSSHTDLITTSGSSDIAMGLSKTPLLKCDLCAEAILIGSNASQLNLPFNFQKDRCFSSPNLSSLNLNVNPHISSSEQNLIPLLSDTVDMDTCTGEDTKTSYRRSKSYSSIPIAPEPSETASTESPQHTAADFFEPAVHLEKENEHFLAADLFISAVERMKSNWQYEQWRTEGGMYWTKKEEPCFHRKKANSESAVSVDSGYEGLTALQNSPAETIFEEDEEDESECSMELEVFDDVEEEYVVIEIQSSDTPERQFSLGGNAAEKIARNLYRAVRQQWTQVDGETPLPTRTTADRKRGNRSIAAEFESSVYLVEEIKKFSIMDTEEWSPRFQIISTLHPSAKRDVIVASQNYLCAGCGTKVEPRYTNRLRYCDYLGKYFCDCCHSYAESFIPGRIISKWNFSKYYVSNVAKSIVDKIWESHQFNIQTENPELYNKVKDLNRVREVQEQLMHVKRLLTTCRFAEDDEVMEAFEEVPSHLTQELHLFTLSDLYNVKQKTLLPLLRELLATTVAHVDSCELCQAKGFICEFCQHEDVIFPFQTEICRRCEVCKACYHKKCFKTGECPKCVRIRAREAMKNDSPFTSSGEMDASTTL